MAWGKEKILMALLQLQLNTIRDHEDTHFGSGNKSIQPIHVCFLIDHQRLISKPKITSFCTLLTFQTQTLTQSEARITKPKCALSSCDTLH